jgi:hypothetical protein
MKRLFFLLTLAIFVLTLNNDAFASIELRDVPQADEFENIPYENAISNTKSAAGFPSKKARAYDPINKKWYDKAIAGKTFKANMFRSYDYWRYVTVYNVETSAERVSYLPYFEESCHDSSFFMAQWGETRNFKVSMTSSVGAKVGVDGLGLDASVSISIEQGVAFSASRRVQAVKGIAARHYPYKLSDTWTGVTYIQTYDKDSGTYGYLLPSYYDEWFGEYPYAFKLDNQNVGFKVKREIIKTCEGYSPSDDPISADELYINGEYVREE